MNTLHVVLPEGIDEPDRPSGGNIYDRRVCDGLGALGWRVRELQVAGGWPRADRISRTRLAAALGALPSRSLVLIDGLVASSAPEVLVPEARRLRLVVLVHLPLGVVSHGPTTASEAHSDRFAERAVLRACRAVVVTSRWTRSWLRVTYGLSARQVPVVTPGTEPAPLAARSTTGRRLLCVGALTPAKGQDVLVAALAGLQDLDWDCAVVGSRTTDPTFADQVARHVADAGLDDRVRFTGPLTGTGLAELRQRADLLLVPSRTETYGMVVTEALARGVPVVGSDVGGLPESLGRDRRGRRPGILVSPDDAGSLGGALRRWLSDATLRDGLHDAALCRRMDLADWEATSATLSDVLSAVDR